MNRKSLIDRKSRWIGVGATGLMALGLFSAPLPGALAAEVPATTSVLPVSQAVLDAVEAARAKAHQALMDLPAWNATIFGPFPAAAITTEANDITFVHINLPSSYGSKTATVRMGVLKDTTWINTSLGTLKLNIYGNGTFKTPIEMPSGTRAQIYVGGKLITTTIRAK